MREKRHKLCVIKKNRLPLALGEHAVLDRVKLAVRDGGLRRQARPAMERGSVVVRLLTNVLAPLFGKVLLEVVVDLARRDHVVVGPRVLADGVGDNVADLQVVVYESMISSICWGVSYLWIRRGI